jgi:hypothetical protein
LQYTMPTTGHNRDRKKKDVERRRKGKRIMNAE